MMQLAVYLITNRELLLNVHFKIYLNVHKKEAPEVALIGALQVALESHLFINLSMQCTRLNDSI